MSNRPEIKRRWAKFLDDRFGDWYEMIRQTEERRPSITEWAQKVVKQSKGNVSNWMAGGEPDEGNKLYLAALFGPEVFDIWGKPEWANGEPELFQLITYWASASEEQRWEAIQILQGNKSIREENLSSLVKDGKPF